MLELQKLLDDGYEVMFSRNADGTYNAYANDMNPERPADYREADAETPGAALWAASPLHPEDEPYPGDGPLVQEVASLRHQVQGLLDRQIAIEAVFEAGGLRNTKSSDQHTKITVTGDCGHVLGTWTDSIEGEKYPFWCEECDADKRIGKYPWTLTTEIVQDAEPRGEHPYPEIASAT